MRYYIPNSNEARNVSPDCVALAYKERRFPAIVDCQRCLDTGALIVDCIDGSTIEIGNAESTVIKYDTGKIDANGEAIFSTSSMLLHLESNLRVWLAHLQYTHNAMLVANATAKARAMAQAA